jgi:predicted dehydrogenase
MADKPIRVGFVGAGANTRKHHIPKLKAQPGVELVAVANRSKESGERVAKEFGIARVEADWRRVVEARDVDAICIGTWPYMHRELTVAALGAGKHVLCEARMAMNAAEGREMLAASHKAPQLTAQLVPAPHTLEVDRVLKKLLAEGYAGEVHAVEVQGTQQARFAELGDAMHWRQDMRLSGNNILNMGIWYEAMMRWLGPARRVMAMTKIAKPKRKDETGAWQEVKVPDHVDILRQRRHAARRGRRQAADRGPARRQRPGRDRHPGRPAHRLAGRGRVRQRHPRAREDHAHQLRGRGALHGVHRRGRPELRQRPGRRRQGPVRGVGR